MKNDHVFNNEKMLFAQEELVFNVTEDVLLAMEDKSIKKSELAEKLGKTKSYVSQVLSGSRNMTLRTLSDICFVLGAKPNITITIEGRDVSLPIDKEQKRHQHWRNDDNCVGIFLGKEKNRKISQSDTIELTSAHLSYEDAA
ncbi:MULTISPECIES: helix-turn-helix domain-containing protein [Photorhabdus]|nr:helix-turn-helix transcriptional regulator [Photorhabdus tasmaniensis]